MTEDALQIIARGPRAVAEAAAAALDEAPRDRDPRPIPSWKRTRITTSGGSTPSRPSKPSTPRWWSPRRLPPLRVTTEKLADADWLAMALSGLPPVRAGRFFVYGAHDRGLAPASTVNLRIEAGAAFGTGHHGTTVGCLLAFDRLLKAQTLPARARRRLRHRRAGDRRRTHRLTLAVGTDIDRVSVRIANENAKLNHSGARFVHAAGLNDQKVRAGAPYDLVFANILAPPLVALAQDIKGALRPGGIAILSGLLRTQERRVSAAYLSRGFRIERRLHRDAWATLVLRRP